MDPFFETARLSSGTDGFAADPFHGAMIDFDALMGYSLTSGQAAGAATAKATPARAKPQPARRGHARWNFGNDVGQSGKMTV